MQALPKDTLRRALCFVPRRMKTPDIRPPTRRGVRASTLLCSFIGEQRISFHGATLARSLAHSIVVSSSPNKAARAGEARRGATLENCEFDNDVDDDGDDKFGGRNVGTMP